MPSKEERLQRVLRTDPEAEVATRTVLDNYVKLCERLVALSYANMASDYARIARVLAHRFFQPGQVGYTMFDRFVK